MITVARKSAATIFYYLMAIDGIVTDAELENFYGFGRQIDPDHFEEYREEIPVEYSARMEAGKIDEEDSYPIILEGIDHALFAEPVGNGQGIHARELIWDMLSVACRVDTYSRLERRAIKHVVRVTNTEKSVFLEMEQMAATYSALEKEETWIKESDRPYSIVEPNIREIEKRKEWILQSANCLIGDEQDAAAFASVTLKRRALEKATDVLKEKTEPLTDKLHDTMAPVTDKVGEAADALKEQAVKKKNSFLHGLKAKIREAVKEDEEESKEKEEDA